MSAGPWEAQSRGCADLLIKIQACPHFSWRFWWFAHTYLCPPPTPSTDQSNSLQCSPALLPTPANPDRPSQNFDSQGEILKILSWRKKPPAFISSDAASSVQWSSVGSAENSAFPKIKPLKPLWPVSHHCKHREGWDAGCVIWRFSLK